MSVTNCNYDGTSEEKLKVTLIYFDYSDSCDAVIFALSFVPLLRSRLYTALCKHNRLF